MYVCMYVCMCVCLYGLNDGLMGEQGGGEGEGRRGRCKGRGRGSEAALQDTSLRSFFPLPSECHSLSLCVVHPAADAQEAVPFPAEHASQDKKGPKVFSKLDPGHKASIKAREIGTFDELSGKPGAKPKQPPVTQPRPPFLPSTMHAGSFDSPPLS
jgi:hypothetical protein